MPTRMRPLLYSKEKLRIFVEAMALLYQFAVHGQSFQSSLFLICNYEAIDALASRKMSHSTFDRGSRRCDKNSNKQRTRALSLEESREEDRSSSKPPPAVSCSQGRPTRRPGVIHPSAPNQRIQGSLRLDRCGSRRIRRIRRLSQSLRKAQTGSSRLALRAGK